MRKRHWFITLILVPIIACAGTTSTPLMNLQLPVPGTQSGPLWAQNLNDAFGLVDSHDHTPGKGSLVPVAGLNINDDLPMANHNLSLPRSVRYTSQSATLSTSNDKNEVYVVNGDLYYNNSSGTAIKLTSGSGLNAASIGGIGGDYASSTASETYTASTKTFTFTQSSGVTAKISAGDLSISENASSALPITIKSPASLGASYSLTLPTALPVSKKIMTVTSAGVMAADYDLDGSTVEASSNVIRVKDAGIVTAKIADSNVTTAKIADGAVTQAKRAALGQQVSSSSAGFSTGSISSGTLVDITNLSVSLTTTGRLVRMDIVADGTSNQADINGACTQGVVVSFVSDGSSVGLYRFGSTAASTNLNPGFGHTFIPAAGAHTLKVQIGPAGGTCGIVAENLKLVAYEL